MFDIGWTELLVIAVVLIVVVGPKDLPPMLRAFGKMTANFRKMAGEFRAQFDEALRESDLDDVRKTIADVKSLNPTNALRDAINPLRQMGQDIRSDFQKSTQSPFETQSPSELQSPPEMTRADAEAQQAIESAPVGGQTPEVPTGAAPVMPVSGALLEQASAAADTATARKLRATRKPAVVKSAVEKTDGIPVQATKLVETGVVGDKPKRRSAGAKPVPIAALDKVDEVVAVKAPRKRAPRKTETPKDDA